MNRDRLISILDRLVKAHDRATSAEIDAGACRTPRDYQRARDARDAADTATDAAADEILAIIESEVRLARLLPAPRPPCVGSACVPAH